MFHHYSPVYLTGIEVTIYRYYMLMLFSFGQVLVGLTIFLFPNDNCKTELYKLYTSSPGPGLLERVTRDEHMRSWSRQAGQVILVLVFALLTARPARQS